ncbi:hypothetical protein AMTR_s00057p00042250 [Amborella trichopoda]|uniref:Uncharacterized protein n=1 Tax=Amborella trichopoda TaxID=13333 RepID=U5CTY6_AMBTC|nr:hypothetical protein AMTR_s00057p00042250 [Amborella trichopoda]
MTDLGYYYKSLWPFKSVTFRECPFKLINMSTRDLGSHPYVLLLWGLLFVWVDSHPQEGYKCPYLGLSTGWAMGHGPCPPQPWHGPNPYVLAQAWPDPKALVKAGVGWHSSGPCFALQLWWPGLWGTSCGPAPSFLGPDCPAHCWAYHHYLSCIT